MSTTHAEGTAGHGADHVPHVLPLKVYLGTWAALLVLTVVTVAASYIDLGSGNLWLALLIASMKAGVVALVFMHLRWDNKFHALIFLMSLIFLAVFIGFTMLDTQNRGRAEPVEADRPADIKAPFSGEHAAEGFRAKPRTPPPLRHAP